MKRILVNIGARKELPVSAQKEVKRMIIKTSTVLENIYIVMHGKLGRYMNIEGASAEASEGNEETKKIIGH